MRLDPVLVFLERCGEPDNKDLKAEQDDGGDEGGDEFKLVEYLEGREEGRKGGGIGA